ncbi:MAG: CvpA family protein [Candidatus Eisenbacteria bacterium]|uniref:CvpA family protein n=1 Tax=Eiseniibacteriota bacterium TaxID=2212470 RepID=A0A933SAA0_UNCEI|nr:CvpA family protein [Candidatus Eisenbacteria bacterium]
MTGLDWIALVLMLVFVIRGILRGTIAQVFAFIGMLAGLAVTVAVAAWVGSHWREARPGPVYFLLRWLVAILAGMAISALFHWWGELVAKAAHDGPFGWLDRLGGGFIGFSIAVLLSSLLVLSAVQAPLLSFARNDAKRGVVARPLLRAGERATAWRALPVPGTRWLHQQYVSALQHLGR